MYSFSACFLRPPERFAAVEDLAALGVEPLPERFDPADLADLPVPLLFADERSEDVPDERPEDAPKVRPDDVPEARFVIERPDADPLLDDVAEVFFAAINLPVSPDSFHINTQCTKNEATIATIPTTKQ